MADGTNFVISTPPLSISRATLGQHSAQTVFDFVVRRQWARLLAVPPGYKGELPHTFHGHFKYKAHWWQRPQQYEWACAVGEVDGFRGGWGGISLVTDGSHGMLLGLLMGIHDQYGNSVALAKSGWPRAWRSLAKVLTLNDHVVTEVCHAA